MAEAPLDVATSFRCHYRLGQLSFVVLHIRSSSPRHPSGHRSTVHPSYHDTTTGMCRTVRTTTPPDELTRLAPMTHPHTTTSTCSYLREINRTYTTSGSSVYALTGVVMYAATQYTFASIPGFATTTLRSTRAPSTSICSSDFTRFAPSCYSARLDSLINHTLAQRHAKFEDIHCTPS
jgi:hypothetical protein